MSTKSVTAAALYEGTYSVGLDKEFVRIDPDDPPKPRSLKLSLNPFLIKNSGQNLLIDAGPGFYGPENHKQWMQNNLAEHNLTTEDITDVFCSHLHSDHIGGLANKGDDGEWELTFLNAKVWVQQDDWEKAVATDTKDDLRGQFIQFVNRKADLQYLLHGDKPYPEISVEVIGGHTKYSLALYLDFGIDKFLMAGDVLATQGEVNRKFAAKYDYDGKASMKIREHLIQKAYEEGFIILAYHNTKTPMFRLVDYMENKGYIIEAVE
ncbi:MAG: MBL fold metallo-hydrolase [Balneolales bacterium]